ncbi:aminotransferase class V-fold PLP-dependent enzyme [Pseudorhodoferax soli]|uniref:Selenocysteine lyase/cysteine desulfurase n=1 Tax=Pseudorhodoferax soli TaxID=545864 RepID=A0A368XFY7_9BURK|nr:aminotransferase class V-fold PLP-dependent enzyme [Pseudorhodoferax soli]RCW66116.1 selenocysteine lyase/cysteine desulfurase [Pseudorhodoferax soli]
MPNTTALESIRSEFPVMEHTLYLDSAHQTPLPNRVRRAIERFLDEGNTKAGPKPVWAARVHDARQMVATLLNAQRDEVAFTKNTSEGLNIAANALALQSGDKVLMLAGDHPNNAYAWLHQRQRGVEVQFVSLSDDAIASGSTFAPHVDASTKVISLSHVTFHAGQRHDIESIGRLCTDRGIHLVVDAMQSVGVVPIDVKRMGVSVLAAGCHKGLFVPQGVGLLYVRGDLQEMQPAYVGMSSLADPPSDFVARPDDARLRNDAGRFEFGNLNLLAIHALMEAVTMVDELGPANVKEHVLGLGDRLIEGLDDLGVGLVGPRKRAERAHIYVMDLPVEPWTLFLSKSGVRVSPERGGVRVSFGAFNTSEDVANLLALLRSPCAPTR